MTQLMKSLTHTHLFLGQTLRFLMQHFGHVAEIMVRPKRSFLRA